MNRDHCIIRAAPFPPAEGCSLSLSLRRYFIYDQIFLLFGKRQGIVERDQMFSCSKQLTVLPLRIENEFFFPR